MGGYFDWEAEGNRSSAAQERMEFGEEAEGSISREIVGSMEEDTAEVEEGADGGAEAE